MSLRSNYPNGFTNGLTIRGLPVTMLHPGQVFWVSNSTALLPGQIGGSNSNAGTFDQPFSTIDYAIGRCTAGRGDLIMVKPGHAETLSAVGALAADVAGVGIVGLGAGASAPTLTVTLATAGVINISVANTSWVNIRFVANVADAEPIVMGAGADGTSFESCVFTDTSTVLNFLNFITITSAADNLSWKDCYFCGKSASNDSFILMSTVHDRFYFTTNHLQSDVAQTSVVGLIKTTGDVTNAWIKDSFFRSNIDGAIFIDFDGTACSGGITNCYFSSINTAGATSEGIDFTGGHVFECYVSGEANAFGLVGGGGVVYDNL
jgi:hypothetical protein